jgi:hypothetical protein
VPSGTDGAQHMAEKETAGTAAASGVFEKYARGAAGALPRAKKEQSCDDDDDFEVDRVRKSKVRRKLE